MIKIKEQESLLHAQNITVRWIGLGSSFVRDSCPGYNICIAQALGLVQRTASEWW